MNQRPSPKSPRRRVRGAVMTEYMFAVGVVGLTIVYGWFSAGEKLVYDYTNARDLVLVPGQ